MPNWCSNKLAVYGPEADVKRFKEQAMGYSPWSKTKEQPENPLNFHSLIPIPPDILAAGYSQTGYHWEIDNWGCKWGACETQLTDEWEGHLTYVFDTPWSPPIEFFTKLAPQWPTLIFLLDYEEMSMGFKGIAKFKGEIVDDHSLSVI